jgi:hypothetical protein
LTLNRDSSIFSDPSVLAAVSNIASRAEQHSERLDDLVVTYVDTGILARLDNMNHQILYGRRGTGKSHVFGVLAATVSRAHVKYRSTWTFENLAALNSSPTMTPVLSP